MDIINRLNTDIQVAKLIDGQRVSHEDYYNKVFNSKILFAPYGYGEMAPRDLEAAMFGSILIKPDVFIDGETYIACKHDFSDLEEKITKVLGNYNDYLYIVENARKKFIESMHPNNLALHLHKIFKNLNGITHE